MKTLTDAEIGSAISHGKLVLNGDVRQLSGASYELRMGNVYYDLTESDKPINVPMGGTILIKPGHRVVLITREALALPDDILGRVISKGSLFSVGLSPVATYADPGFSGNLGIVTQNISDKYIELPLDEAIAKIDFTELSGNVDKPYRGQHGFQTQIWPIKHQLQKSYAQVCADARVESEMAEAYKLLPDPTAKLLRRLEKRQKAVDVAIIIAVLLNAAALAAVSQQWLDAYLGVVGNLVATVVVLVAGQWIARKE